LADVNADDQIKELIVAGAVNGKGDKKWLGSNYDDGKKLPHIYAPGDTVKCTKHKNEDPTSTEYRDSSGTSQG
jgi:hypothetical protein